MAAADIVAFVGEGPVFSGDPLGCIQAARWTVNQEPDLGESDLEQSGAEAIFQDRMTAVIGSASDWSEGVQPISGRMSAER